MDVDFKRKYGHTQMRASKLNCNGSMCVESIVVVAVARCGVDTSKQTGEKTINAIDCDHGSLEEK